MDKLASLTHTISSPVTACGHSFNSVKRRLDETNEKQRNKTTSSKNINSNGSQISKKSGEQHKTY
jgi:hypothetical protein